MRRITLATLTAAMLLGAAVPAFAHPGVALDPTLPTDLTFEATDNVDYLGRFPEHTGNAGGLLSGDGRLFYLTDPRGVYVYDVTKPELPKRLGSLAVYQQTTGVALAQEDPDTNGKILLVDGATSPVSTSASLHVVDVSNPTSLKVLDTVAVTDHTWTCVSGTDDTGAENSCAYAYGRSGHIVDLTNPADATLLSNTWRQAVGYGNKGNSPYTHDLTEIRPGLVMSAGSTAILMDTRNPVAPVKLSAIAQPGRFNSLGYHSIEWAKGGRDPYLVMGTEIAPTPVPGLPNQTENTAGSDCEGNNSVIETWDARQIVAGMEAYEAGATVEEAFGSAAFTKIDAFDAGGRGIFLQGQAPAHQLYCAHWMELHPQFDGGGKVAVSYYDRGTRFLNVDGETGKMSEVGWIVPADGYSGSAQWVSDEVVYIMDYRRGMEVVSLEQDEKTKKVKKARGVKRNQSDAIAASSTLSGSQAPVSEQAVAYGLLAVLALMVFGGDLRWRSRRRSANKG